ncbi:hypothetical protein [Sphingomonas sp. M1-B02]|uniref:hypothetical protein n=1 Tax=Sphingomonas sp. M1-B02 TaxID=3114300 RepID=UPI00223EEDFB|nr:hypothetical protein [Sphingomonas sp. S6-11]UZK66054.1 hypothetical protein OKW87_16345 [Sphingomonas sp. S6-11]
MTELPFHTPTQLVALALTLFAGWLFGLASSSGGRKWRERYQAEELAHSTARSRAEDDLRDANQRIRELEAENGRLARLLDASTPAAVEVAPSPVVPDETRRL